MGGGGTYYSQVGAGDFHTVLLRSDGTAVAFGGNHYGQCNIPACPPDMTYTNVAAGNLHTVLLRSDGNVVACGGNAFGQCNIPSLRTLAEWLSAQPARVRYVAESVHAPSLPALVLQAVLDGTGTTIRFQTLSGEVLYELQAKATDRLADIRDCLLGQV